MRILTYVALGFALLFAPMVQAAPAKLLVVYFHADWCPNCPPVHAAISEVQRDGTLEARGVQFVTMDFTNKQRIRLMIPQAEALGIGDYLKQRGSSVGYVAVFDTKRRELSRFYRDDTAADIRAALDEYLAQ